MENPKDINNVEVLLVEDSPYDAELTIHALSDIVSRLFWAKDGEEALEFIFCTGRYATRKTNSHPKVILLDLKLPKVSGLEVLAKIKSDEHTKMIPVVVVTSSQEGSDLKEAYKLGVNSYIVKPIESANFKKALSEAGIYWTSVNKPPASKL